MNKSLYNLLVNIQKKQGTLFNLIMFTNEIYIRLLFMLRKESLSNKDFKVTFSAGEKSFYIKKLTIDDLTSLINFFKNSIDTQSKAFIMPHRTSDSSLKKILKRVSHIPLGIYSEDNKMIGYSLIRLLFPNKGSYAIFIADKLQGKGIGTAALGEQLKIIRSLGYVPVSAVSKQNPKSIRMLEKLGMEFGEDMGSYLEVKDTSNER